METKGQVVRITIAMLRFLNNSLVLRQLAPYLSVRSLLSLAATCKDVRKLLYESTETFRYLDLSNQKSAALPWTPIDTGGINWRSQRMDEALTEDEFYSGPLRGVFSKLSRHNLLKNVQTLILDSLSVPADLIHEILTDERFNVKILSIREARHLNQRKLRDAIKYAVRPTRPPGTPRVRAIYVFGPADPAPPSMTTTSAYHPSSSSTETGVLTREGAQIGAAWNAKSQDALHNSLSAPGQMWYSPSGKVIRHSPDADWVPVLQAAEGIIAFDAVLCRGPRHDISTYSADPASYLPPSIATVALGHEGCNKCGTCEEGPAIWNISPSHHLPLTSPPPLHSSSSRTAQRPYFYAGSKPPVFIARCEECLRGRWCEKCSKWWDEPCYLPPVTGQHSSEVGVARHCFDCGRVCAQCESFSMRSCKCGNYFCTIFKHYEGSTSTTCDWCSSGGRRGRTRELY